MAWYDSAVFYQIYPLGLCGCPHENNGARGSCFAQLTEWVNHAKEIQCTAVYFGPLFQSLTHGYDTTDYRLVDTRLGTNEDFAALVSHCHEIGMKVIVDGVFNHVGRGFFAFRDVQEHREASRYCGWFRDINFGGNNEYNDGFCYANWGGHNSLVKLNQQNPEVQQYLYDTIQFWAKQFDIDGIRLDAADVLDFGFLHGLRAFCDTLKPEFWLMGEVIHGDYGRWVNPEMLHSVTNYALNKGLWSGHNEHNYFEIAHTIRYVRGLCGESRLLSFADNHDVARIMSKLTNPAHFPLAAMLLYAVPGIPCIYYGSEFGIRADKQSYDDWNLRPALMLSDFAADAAAQAYAHLFAQLGELKKRYPALNGGDYRELLLQNRQFAVARTLGGVSIVTALNNDDAPSRLDMELPVPCAAAEILVQAGGAGGTATVENGRLAVCLPPNSGMVVKLGENA